MLVFHASLKMNCMNSQTDLGAIIFPRHPDCYEDCHMSHGMCMHLLSGNLRNRNPDVAEFLVVHSLYKRKDPGNQTTKPKEHEPINLSLTELSTPTNPMVATEVRKVFPNSFRTIRPRILARSQVGYPTIQLQYVLELCWLVFAIY